MFEETVCYPCSTVSQAARYGKLEDMKQLIDKGHPCDVADNRGWRAIHEAVQGNYLDCLKYLLEIGLTNTNWQSFEGITPLHLACELNNLEAVEMLLEHGADPNLKDHMDTYPIMNAVKCNNMDIVRLLVGHGARTNVQIYCGTSPLHQAAAEGFADMVGLLLECGARLDIKEDYDITPIFSAAHYGHPSCLKLLLEKLHETDELHLVDSPADDGATPLYLAAQEGHSGCVKLLLKHGADPNRGTSQPKALPLHAALQFNRIVCVELLLKCTDKDRFLDCDLSPFYFSTIHPDTTCTQLLIAAGFDPSHRHTSQDEYFQPRVFRHFMSNVKFSQRMSPLVLLAMNHHPMDHAHVLLTAGACPNPRTRYEAPPLLAALESKNLDLAEMLIRHGAKVNVYHPRVISNLTILLSQYHWKSLNLLLHCGAEAESLFQAKPVLSRYSSLTSSEDQMSDDDSENEASNMRNPIPFWRSIRESRVASGMFASTELLKFVLNFVGSVSIDAHLQGYVDSKEDWNQISAVVASPRPLTHLCRLTIRHQMSPLQLLDKTDIKTLPLPEPVIEFLLYKELQS